MIGYLEGQVKQASIGHVILFCNGIGFSVNIPKNLNYTEGQNTSFFIHTHLRDDDLSLFGFSTYTDLKLFETLITVSGVGPKIGLTMFASSTAQNIIDAIATSNLNFFTSIPGVGKKTAQRLILDLKSKLSKGDINMSAMEGNSELTDSLIALGYQKTEISAVIAKIDSTQSLGTQVKEALKLLKKP